MSLLHRILDFVCPDAALRLPRFPPWPPLDSPPSVPRFDAFAAAELANADTDAQSSPNGSEGRW